MVTRQRNAYTILMEFRWRAYLVLILSADWVTLYFPGVGAQLAYIVGPATAHERYAIQWRIACGPLVVHCCVLAGGPYQYP